MIMDDKLLFSEAQTLTATAVSTNVVNTGVADSKIGDGSPVYLNVVVDTAFTGQGSTTLTIDLQDSANNSSFSDVLGLVTTIAETSLTAGAKVLKVALPTGLRQYLRLNYTVASGPFTAGAVNAYLSLAAESEV